MQMYPSYIDIIPYYARYEKPLKSSHVNWPKNVALRACLHGAGDPGLVGLVSFVFTLWGTQNKRNLPH